MNDPYVDENYSLRFLLATIMDHWRNFWANIAPFKGPQALLMCCFQNFRGTYKNTVSRVGLGSRGSKKPQEQLTQTLIASFQKSYYFFPMVFDCKKPTNYNWVRSQTWFDTEICAQCSFWWRHDLGRGTNRHRQSYQKSTLQSQGNSPIHIV